MNSQFSQLQKEFGHYKLTFIGLQNNLLHFSNNDLNTCVHCYIHPNSLITESYITLNTPNINWDSIEVINEVTTEITHYLNITENWGSGF